LGHARLTCSGSSTSRAARTPARTRNPAAR
jgi:hypothetical protein